MKSATAESIAFKLIGYYCLIQAILLFCTTAGQVYSIINFGQPPGSGFLFLSGAWFLTIAGLVLLGLFLIGKGRRGSPDKTGISDDRPESMVSPTEIQTIAFSILGAYFFISAFPEFLRSMMILISAIMRTDMPYEGVMAERIGERFSGAWTLVFKNSWPDLVKIVIEMGIGAFLFYKGSLLSGHWNRSQKKTAPAE